MTYSFNPFPVIETNRLILRELSDTDAQAIFNYQSDKQNFQYVDMPVYTHIDQAKNYIAKMKAGVAQDKWIIWAITQKESKEIIGTISIWNLNDKENKAEYGYGIFPDYRRRGFMKETIEAVNTYAFETMKLHVLEAYTSHHNQASKDFLVKMNFNFIETIEDDYSDGALMDVFSLKRG